MLGNNRLKYSILKGKRDTEGHFGWTVVSLTAG